MSWAFKKQSRFSRVKTSVIQFYMLRSVILLLIFYAISFPAFMQHLNSIKKTTILKSRNFDKSKLLHDPGHFVL